MIDIEGKANFFVENYQARFGIYSLTCYQ